MPLWRVLAGLSLIAVYTTVWADDRQTPVQLEAREGEESEEPEAPDLLERLTERNDKRIELDPYRIGLAGRVLSIGGQYELGYERIHTGGRRPNLELRRGNAFAQELELEAFYRFDAHHSVFAQGRLVMVDEDYGESDADELTKYAERGEMWYRYEAIAGSDWVFDIGRIDYEDRRHWWWDDELDSARLTHDGDNLVFSVSLAKELGGVRSNLNDLAADEKGVIRGLATVDWTWTDNQSAQLFLLHQNDDSARLQPDDFARPGQEDPSDANLTWLGGLVTGVFELSSTGLLGYWLNGGWVNGTEHLTVFEDDPDKGLRADSVRRRKVDGWAVDTGVSWMPDWSWEPRFFAGYAYGSGDSDPESKNDRAFRQTGLESNDAGFGGVEEFPNYGILIDPELSNIGIASVGVGGALFRASSLDLVYHHYRLAEPAESLRDSNIEVELTGIDRDFGQALDLVLALEEWKQIELLLTVSAFRAGRAFGRDHGEMSYGGFAGVRITF
jgi:alginate production protein